MSEVYNLSQLKVGLSAKILRIEDPEIKRKLVSLGFIEDRKLKLIRKAPLGGAYYVEINAHLYALRKQEAREVLLKN